MDGKEDLDKPSEALQCEAAAAYAALQRFHQLALAECAADRDGDAPLPVTLEWSPLTTFDQFVSDAFARCRAAASERGPIRERHVYCYHCRSVCCEHAKPNSHSCVFAGYADTGRPKWMEFCNFLLAVDDDRVDLLFAEPPAVLARVIGRRTLITEQLESYGRKSITYRILGQVVAGYITMRGLCFALTIQVVEGKRHRLAVQVIMSEEACETIADAADGSSLNRIHNAIATTREQIRKIDNQWQAAQPNRKRKKELTNQIFSVLNHLAASLERKGRQHRRRSRHAEERSSQNRPVHKARDDIRTARVQDFFRDEIKRSIVVIGKNRRSHVFTEAGRHITSLHIPTDKIESRCRRKRYCPMATADITRFREVVAAT